MGNGSDDHNIVSAEKDVDPDDLTDNGEICPKHLTRLSNKYAKKMGRGNDSRPIYSLRATISP
jgi:hypothetical protein